MANLTIFVTPQFVKETTRIDQNVDDKLLVIDIYDMQQLYLEPILGTRLYNRIAADVVANTLTGDYLTLMCDYVQPTLARYVAMIANWSLLQSYNNKSVSTKSGENSNPVDYTRQRSGTDMTRQIAEHSKQRLIDHLCAKMALYPEYSTNSGVDEIRPETNSYTTPMHLGSSKFCDRDRRYYD